MYKRFHGIDLHKRYATISIRNEDGKEIYSITRCYQFSSMWHTGRIVTSKKFRTGC